MRINLTSKNRLAIVEICTIGAFACIIVAAIWQNSKPATFGGVLAGAAFAYAIYRLSQKTSPLTFIESFREYCRQCTASLRMAIDDSEIATIQTPITVNGSNEEDYTNYIASTAKVLLAQSSNKRSHKIARYRRLVVINDKTRLQELVNEKEKLTRLITEIYRELESSNHWSPTLKNINIAIVDAIHINKSPYANIDILIVSECALKLCFPKYQPERKEFVWGTSLHITQNSLLENYKENCHHFNEIFDGAWQICEARQRTINLGSFYNSNDKDNSKQKTIKAIDQLFKTV